MALIDQTAARVEIPHEPGNFVLLRRLTGAESDDVEARGLAVQFGSSGLGEDDGLYQSARIVQVLGTFPKGGSESEQQTWRARIPFALAADAALRLACAGFDGPSYGGAVGGGAVVACDSATRRWLATEVVLRNTRPFTGGTG